LIFTNLIHQHQFKGIHRSFSRTVAIDAFILTVHGLGAMQYNVLKVSN